MSQTKREQVISHIRYLRQELREMHLGIKEDNLFPEPGELRGIMAQLEALLELIEGNTKIQSNSEAAQLSAKWLLDPKRQNFNYLLWTIFRH